MHIYFLISRKIMSFKSSVISVALLSCLHLSVLDESILILDILLRKNNLFPKRFDYIFLPSICTVRGFEPTL